MKSQNGLKGFTIAGRFFRTTLLILLVSVFAFGFNLSVVSSTTHDDTSEIVLTQVSVSMVFEQSVASHSANQQHCSFQIVCQTPILLETASFIPSTADNSLHLDFGAHIAPKGQTVSVILPPPLV